MSDVSSAQHPVGLPLEALRTLADLSSDISNSPAPADLNRLAEYTQVPLDVLEGMFRRVETRSPTLRFGHHLIRRDLLDQKHRRACPECLEASAHHQRIWDVALVTACPVHRKRMVHRCDVCEQKLAWKGLDLCRCACGRDLTRIRCEPVSAEASAATGFIYGVLGEPAFAEGAATVCSKAPFADLTPGAVVDFLRVFCLIRPGRWPSGGAVPHLGEDAHELVAEAYQACQDWPENVVEYLDRIGNHRLGWTGPGFSGDYLRRLVTWLSRLAPGEGQMLMKALVPYLREYTSGVPRPPN